MVIHYIRTFFISVSVSLLVLVLLAYGIHLSTSSDGTSVSGGQPSTSTTSLLQRNLENTLDEHFPKGLINEKNITVVESFSVKETLYTQYTYRYITTVPPTKSFTEFRATMEKLGWQKGLLTQLPSGWSVDFTKQTDTLSITYSTNTLTQATTIDLTLLIYK